MIVKRKLYSDYKLQKQELIKDEDGNKYDIYYLQNVKTGEVITKKVKVPEINWSSEIMNSYVKKRSNNSKSKTYSNLSDEEFNKRRKHNLNVMREEYAEKLLIKSKYKDKLPDYSKDVDIFEKEYDKQVKSAKVSKSEKLRALKNSLKDSSHAAGYYLKNKKIGHFDKLNINEANWVTEEIPLKKRISKALKLVSPKEIKDIYNNNIDGIKHDKAYKATKHLDPSTRKETPIEKEYYKELDKITEKYKPKYKNFE